MEVLEFHIACPEQEAKTLRAHHKLADDDIPGNFFTFNFCAYDYDTVLPQLFILIIHDTFGNRLFDLDKLCRFTLTVRKNYRPVSYHNWQHGFHVAHCIWRMIRICESAGFTHHEKLSLIIAAICHDLDHRGYNNDFFKKTDHSLAALYSSSIMECHHYKQTVTILHASGHDILSFLTPDEHKIVLEKIRLVKQLAFVLLPNFKKKHGIHDILSFLTPDEHKFVLEKIREV